MYKAFLLVLLTALSMATTATASPSPADAGTDPASYREMHRLQQTDLEKRKRKSRRQAHAKPAAPPAPHAAPEPQLSGRQMEQKLQNARRKQAPGAKP